MTATAPLLDFFKSGKADRETRLDAARGTLAPRACEQVEILLLLLDDAESDVRRSAEETIQRIPPTRLADYLADPDVPAHVAAFFAGRSVRPDPLATRLDEDEPLIGAAEEPDEQPLALPVDDEDLAQRESAAQLIAKMTFPKRLQAAVKGNREMRALLIRDPNKTISAAVLSSPKLTESEIESFARMSSLPVETLRIIGANRRWTKNYQVVVGLTKNPKTPLAMSLKFLSRLSSRDLQMLSIDRNIPDPLRMAARKRIVASTSTR